jgi:hypothetical protein
MQVLRQCCKPLEDTHQTLRPVGSLLITGWEFKNRQSPAIGQNGYTFADDREIVHGCDASPIVRQPNQPALRVNPTAEPPGF